MHGPDPVGWSLLAAGFFLLLQCTRLMQRWRRGRPAKVDWIKGIRGLPRAYFHTVHDVVTRQKQTGRMHVLAAGGFSLAIFLSWPLHLFGIARNLLAIAVILACGLSLIGCVLDAMRRRPARPAHLSGGAFARFPAVLAVCNLSLVLAAVAAFCGNIPHPGIWLITLLLGAVSFGPLLAGIWRGPFRHAFAGTVHLVAHPRPLRAAGQSDTALRVLDLEREPLGVSRPQDFRWNQLLSFDACVQCGRCESACPAFAAGQPLNPKRFIQDLVAATGPDAAFYEGSPHPGHLPAGPTTGLIPQETLFACTTCRACVHECPMLIEHVDTMIDLRRFAALDSGQMPPKSQDAVLALRETGTLSGTPLPERSDWAADLGLRRLHAGDSCDILLWIGEGGFDPRYRRVLRALSRLFQAANIDFAILDEEPDCGDLARRLGDEDSFQRIAMDVIDRLSKRRFNRIVTADPHALHCLAREYPALGGHWDIVHHTPLLLALAEDGSLALTKTAARRVTYHDPCYLGRYMGQFDAPRALLRAAGLDIIEMERSRERSSCCGGGGGAALADVSGRRIPDIRMEHVTATEADIVAVACPGCMQMLEGVPGSHAEVLDIAELLLPALAVAA